MLEMYPSADAEKNAEISRRLFSRLPLTGAPFLLAADGETVGMLELELPPAGNGILAVGILPEYRGRGYGDFFTRAAMLRLSELSDEIRAAYVSDYFLRFGFRQRGGSMFVSSQDLVFPHGCGSSDKI